MKIRAKKDWVRFWFIEVGQAFKFDGEIYLKTNKIETKDNNDLNAINLQENYFKYFEVNCEVEKFNGVLVEE